MHGIGVPTAFYIRCPNYVFDVNMSEEQILCFNGKECTYKECGMFSQEIDTCKLGLLKGKPDPIKPTRNKHIDMVEPTQAPLTDDSVESKLSEYINDLDLSSAPEIISPKKFMGDRWSSVMEILRPLGYGWVSDGKNSRWEHGKQAPRDRDLSGFGKSTVEVDVSEIEWNVKDGDQTVQARTGEKAWAFVMGYDKDAKKSTGEPKQSTQALHDYLQQTEHYCDGVYVYFMNKDASFFSRDPMP